jgi:hypothetical protein
MSANIDPQEAAARPGPGVSPGRAPACGARTRTGSPCLGLAMVNGRCPAGQARGQAPHGGVSTGPRTTVGLARMVAVKTTHGGYAMSGAPKRQAQCCVRMLIVRIGLACTATRLRAYLPAAMAARLDMAPEELRAPKHPSRVAFEALHATTHCDGLPAGLGLGRRARLGAGGGVANGTAAVPLHRRQTERLAAQAEAATQAPWRTAIAAARGAKRAAQEARRQTHNSRNDPMCGAVAGAQTRNPRNDPKRGAAVRARVALAGVPVGAPWEVPAGRPVGDATGWAPYRIHASRVVGRPGGLHDTDRPGSPIASKQGFNTEDTEKARRTRKGRISGASRARPIQHHAKRISVFPFRVLRAFSVSSVLKPCLLAANQTQGHHPTHNPFTQRCVHPEGWAPGSPGLGEALARDVRARRRRAELALRGNDPMRGPEAGADPGTKKPGGGARVARKVPPLGSMRGLALGSTTLARTWEPSVAEILAARFGPAAPVGWLGASEGWPLAPVAPLGVAPMPSGDCAQRPHTGPATLGVRTGRG